MSKKYKWLNAKSRDFLSKDYLREGQTAEERICEIATAAEKILGIEGFSVKFEDYMSRGWISLSSPQWTNFGNERGLPVSCNGSYISDSMEAILGKVAEIGMMTKNGAGTSAYFGSLRPRGAPISKGGESSGPVHFMQMFDSVTNVVSQSSVRRGSMAAYLPIDAPDIEEFLRVKGPGNPIQNLSIGVCVSDQWMKEMTGGDKGKRNLWLKVLQKRKESGYPYIFFSDTVNNNAPKVYRDKKKRIYASNLCVAPETLLLTNEGHIPISSLEGQEVEVWNGKQWSKTTVVKTGKNQKLFKVLLSDGKYLECTDYHKWYVVESFAQQSKGEFTEKRTFELKEGDALIKFDCPVIEGSSENDFKHPYTHGFFCGDGSYSSGKPHLALYGEKKNLIPYLEIHSSSFEVLKEDKINLALARDLNKKFDVPLNASIENRLRWLEGLFDADGCVARNGTNESLQLVSTHLEFLKEVQLLLQTLGVNSKVVHCADEGDKILPDGRGGSKLYFCKQTYRILINSSNLFNLSLIGFSPKRLKFVQKKPQRDATQFVRVKSVTDEDRKDDTYCVSEPLEHKAVFNGILTGNCSEICLPSTEDESFICNLSSLNLEKWDEWKDTDLVETLVAFLDASTTEYIRKTSGIKFMEAANKFAREHRSIGLGVLGWHSLLQSKRIPFESMAAKLLNVQIFKHINEKSLAASKELAARFGEPEILKGYGERFTTRLAIAPTTSSSFILGQVSQGIEPQNSNYFVKKLAKGSYTYKNPYLKELLEEKGKDTPEVWKSILENGGSVQHLNFLSQDEKDVFKTFGEISQKEIIIQAAARQKYIDQSQSLNLMMHHETPLKDVSKLLIFAWENGVKTLYYARSTNPAQEKVRDILSCKSCEA